MSFSSGSTLQVCKHGAPSWKEIYRTVVFQRKKSMKYISSHFVDQSTLLNRSSSVLYVTVSCQQLAFQHLTETFPAATLNLLITYCCLFTNAVFRHPFIAPPFLFLEAVFAPHSPVLTWPSCEQSASSHGLPRKHWELVGLEKKANGLWISERLQVVLNGQLMSAPETWWLRVLSRDHTRRVPQSN